MHKNLNKEAEKIKVFSKTNTVYTHVHNNTWKYNY